MEDFRKFILQIVERFRISEIGKNALLWTTACFTGAFLSFYATSVVKVEHWANRLASFSPYIFLIITPLGTLLSWWLVNKHAPAAAGSGIPQVVVTISNGENHVHQLGKKLLGLKNIFIKVLSSLIMILVGGSVGREGPSVQIASAIFLIAGEHAKKFVEGIQLRQWVLAGAGAGLAAAFNTPLGGLVFVIEELVDGPWFKIKSALLGCIIIAGFTSFYLQGNYLYLGFPGLGKIALSSVFSGLLCGLITGLMGALFSIILLWGINLRAKLQAKIPFWLQTFFLGCILAVGLQFFHTSLIGTGREIILDFLFKEKESSPLIILCRFLGPILSYLCGGAGGIFAPSLAAGASIGQYIAQLISSNNPQLYVLLGMIGFLTGVTRTPFTSLILVIEMTDKHQAILPMMTASLIAYWAARIVGPHSLYHLLAQNWSSIVNHHLPADKENKSV